ncbi:MAG: hypothetical protein HZC40_12825 [Chloroflexi bacterium]|nr:hypothetical protein [Chloroflexota bacterium]
MSEKPSISIGGNVGGAVTIGDNNVQIGSVASGGRVVVGAGSISDVFQEIKTLARFATPEELGAFANLFRALDQEIAKQPSPEIQVQAQNQVEQIKQAVAGEKPNVPMLEQAKKWFADNLPALLGTVTGILTHPLIGKAVEAAGEFTLKQFRDRLGLPQT